MFLTSLPDPEALLAGCLAALLSLSPVSSFLFSGPKKMKLFIVRKHMLINARCTMSRQLQLILLDGASSLFDSF